jgi:hypothetical protein
MAALGLLDEASSNLFVLLKYRFDVGHPLVALKSMD